MTELFTVQQTTDSIAVEDILEGGYMEPPVVVTDIPRFDLRLPVDGGINAYRLHVGKEATISRAGQQEFVGIIETSEPMKDNRGAYIGVEGIDKGYHYLRRAFLSSYDFDEDGDAVTTRDGVTVNPHAPFIFYEPDTAVGVYGNGTAVHGYRVDQFIDHVCGNKFAYQIDFQDNSHLLASDIYDVSNVLQVYRDGPSGDKRPSLQRVRQDSAGFHENLVAEAVESIPLMNGDPYIQGMGDISNVEVVLVGVRDGTDDPVLEVCRDAGDASGATLVNNTTRTYTSVTLTHNASYNGSGLSAWTGTVDLTSDGATEKGMLGFRIRIAGTDGSAATTKVYYAGFLADTDETLGLTRGTVEVYDTPTDIVGLATTEQDWMEGDYLGMSCIKAVERVRTQTGTDSANNQSEHWDYYIDSTQTYHFQERRGIDRARPYTFHDEAGRTGTDGTLLSIKHEFYGGEIAYQTIAYGAGAGTAHNRIVNKSEFSAGGLYDSDRDPHNGGTSEFTSIAQVRRFIDPDETSAVALLRKAWAFHRVHREPTEKFEVKILSEHIPFFGTGDAINIQNLDTRTDDTLRVVELERRFSGDDREQLNVVLGQPQPDFVDRTAQIGGKVETVTIRPGPRQGSAGLAGNGVYIDKDHFSPYSFAVPEDTERVVLKLATLPWQATAKAVDITGITIAGEGAHTHGIPSLTVNGKTNGTSTEPPGDTDEASLAANDPVIFHRELFPTTNMSGANDSATLDVANIIPGTTETGNADFVADHAVITVCVWTETANFRQSLREGLIQPSIVQGANTWSGELYGWGAPSEATAADIVPYVATCIVPINDTIQGQSGDNTITLRVYVDNQVQDTNGDLTISATGYIVREHKHTHATQHQHDVEATTTQTDTSDAGSTHTHGFSGTAGLGFGLFQFGGDSDTTGTATPVYGQDITFAIDPTVSAAGVPTAFGTERHPAIFGENSGPVTIEVDVTGYLAVDSGGRILSGEHKVYFQGTADAAGDNDDGLAVVSVTPIYFTRPSDS